MPSIRVFITRRVEETLYFDSIEDVESLARDSTVDIDHVTVNDVDFTAALNWLCINRYGMEDESIRDAMIGVIRTHLVASSKLRAFDTNLVRWLQHWIPSPDDTVESILDSYFAWLRTR